MRGEREREGELALRRAVGCSFHFWKCWVGYGFNDEGREGEGEAGGISHACKLSALCLRIPLLVACTAVAIAAWVGESSHTHSLSLSLSLAFTDSLPHA
jgi:hypothetical protein